MDTNSNKLGDRIYEARLQKNISQAELSQRVGVSRQMVQKWEANLSYPKTDKLKLICEALDVEIEFLLPKSTTDDNAQSDAISNDANEVVCDELGQNNAEERTLEIKITKKKCKLSNKAKIIIAATIVLIVMLIGLTMIIVDGLRTPTEEGSFGVEETVFEWNFSIENIGWIVFSISLAIAVILGVVLTSVIVKNRKHNGKKQMALGHKKKI